MIGGYQAHVQTGHRDKNGTQDQTPQGPPEHFGEQPYWRLHFSPRGLLAGGVRMAGFSSSTSILDANPTRSSTRAFH